MIKVVREKEEEKEEQKVKKKWRKSAKTIRDDASGRS